MVFKDGSICPACDKGALKYEVKDTELTYRNVTTTYTISMYTCELCGEFVSNPDSTEALSNNL